MALITLSKIKAWVFGSEYAKMCRNDCEDSRKAVVKKNATRQRNDRTTDIAVSEGA